MDIDNQIRALVKEELDKQLVKIREQLSSTSSKIDDLEREQNKKWNLILRLKKHTLDELMAEYRMLKEETHQMTEKQAEI